MMEAVNSGEPGKVITFYVGGVLCGIDILAIQEVNRITDITPVPLGPDHVRGIINLRGRIVTVIDLAHRLGFSAPDPGYRRGDERNIIVHTQGEFVGLVVEQVGEAVAVNWREMVPPPGNIKGDGGCYKGVFRWKAGLIAVLDVAAVLA